MPEAARAVATSEEHDYNVTLTTTSFFSELICFTLKLNEQTFELLNRPTTISVSVQIEDTVTAVLAVEAPVFAWS